MVPCTAIYSKDYQHGTLFAMKLEEQGYVRSMDKEILKLDTTLRRGSTATKFTSISDVLSGKLKSFGHKDHMADEHYRAIFSNGSHAGRKELAVHPDVKIWRPEQPTARENTGKFIWIELLEAIVAETFFSKCIWGVDG